LSVTGVPDAWNSGGRLDSLLIELLLRLHVERVWKSDCAAARVAAW
jgi:hypothetical protein